MAVPTPIHVGTRDIGPWGHLDTAGPALGAALKSISTPATAQQLLEPIALTPAVEQGVDMAYVDREIAGNFDGEYLDSTTYARYAGARLDLVQAAGRP